MHFAASVQVGESVEEPAIYFHNNVTETLDLLESMRESGCNKFILPSTAATFGEPEYTPIDESHPQNPINPYGLTKLINEQMLDWYHRAYGFKYHVFRYFNASGATEKHGEIREIETHIIPLLLAAVMENKNFTLFGKDYPTPDGTCVRDYIHVSDLAQAHILGIDNLDKIPNASYNLGNGNGFSNLEVIEAVRQVTGVDVKFSIGPRRDGDPAVLLASSEKARKELGWQPQFTGLTDIVESAYKFYMKTSP
jgi:UDP-glucose 4-epimerase